MYADATDAIIEDALDRLDKGIPLAASQTIVFREWITHLTAKLHRLEIRRDTGMLSEYGYEELSAVKEILQRYGGRV